MGSKLFTKVKLFHMYSLCMLTVGDQRHKLRSIDVNDRKMQVKLLVKQA